MTHTPWVIAPRDPYGGIEGAWPGFVKEAGGIEFGLDKGI